MKKVRYIYYLTFFIYTNSSRLWKLISTTVTGNIPSSITLTSSIYISIRNHRIYCNTLSSIMYSPWKRTWFILHSSTRTSNYSLIRTSIRKIPSITSYTGSRNSSSICSRPVIAWSNICYWPCKRTISNSIWWVYSSRSSITRTSLCITTLTCILRSITTIIITILCSILSSSSAYYTTRSPSRISIRSTRTSRYTTTSISIWTTHSSIITSSCLCITRTTSSTRNTCCRICCITISMWYGSPWSSSTTSIILCTILIYKASR